MIAIKFSLTSSTFYTTLASHFQFDLNMSKCFRSTEFNKKAFRYRDLGISFFLHSQSRADSGFCYQFKV